MTAPKRFKAHGSNGTLDVISQRHAAGDIPVCPKCDANLVIALSWSEASALNAHPGVFCPNDQRHFQILVNLK
jgi:hypothetical protein